MAPTKSALAALLLGSSAFSAAAAAQNRPPLARASSASDEVVVGTSLQFVGSGSLDPDGGPAPLTFEWDFGDGELSTEADPMHAFAAVGPHLVTLTVRDGAAQSLATLTVHVLAPVGGPSTSSSSLALAGGELWVVNPDSGSVTVVDAATRAVRAEIEVCARPVSIAIAGDRALVSCRDDGAVAIVGRSDRAVLGATRVGDQPWGIARAPSGEILVAVEGSDEIARLTPDGMSVIARIAAGDGPRAIAIDADGRFAYASHFITRGAEGSVVRIDLASAATTTSTLADDPGPDRVTIGRGIPNLLGAIAIEPSGLRVWIGGLKSNSNRGQVLSGEPFPFTNRVRGCAVPIAAGGADLVAERIDTNDADRVSAFAFSASGRYAYLSHPGAGRVSIYDLSRVRTFSPADGDAVPFEARVDVGDWPTGLALDGTTLWVSNELSRDLSVVDVGSAAAPAVVATIATTSEPLDPAVALGKRLFHRSRGPIHSQDDYIACASCHPEGGMDGRTWDITQYGEGLRNTIELRGRGGTAHGPVHWSANFDEIQDFENDIVGAFGGAGLAHDGMAPFAPLGPRPNGGRSEELDALAAYVATFTTPNPSPHRNGELSEPARRGRAIFEDPRTRCAECHVPPRFTDSVLAPSPEDYVLHDVGTLRAESGTRLGGPLVGLDTPSLLGVWDTAPYLHDGRAPTLREVLRDENPRDEHGVTSHLSDAEIDDLVAYLLELDGTPDAPPGADAGVPDADVPDAGTTPAPPDEGCGCQTNSGATGLGWLAIALLCARKRRAR